LSAWRAGFPGTGADGAVGNNSSGDIFPAFSTANRRPINGGAKLLHAAFLRNDAIDPVFNAVVEATEEAVDSMICNKTMVGRDGTPPPLDQVWPL
jgi:L-aminopeptidase/D-esterase-like protein